MWEQIGNWLYQNAMAIFISAVASLLISKRYYDKANRESVLMTVIFPIVKLLNQRYYTRKDYEALFEINSSYAVKYLRKKERNKLLELLSVFTFDDNSELSEMSDEVCKLHMDTDCIVVDEAMYSFNYKFEDLFNIEKTMQKVKNKALEEIISIDAFGNIEEFEQMARAYKSPRTFITLKSERVERIKNKTKRKKVASMLKIEVNDNGKFVFKNEEEVSLLLRYLCFKVFKDDETKELLEANNVTHLTL